VLSWLNLIEARIRDARARGLFDRLRGRGRPLQDPSADLPAGERLDARIAASVGGMPAEIDRVRAVRELREARDRATEPAERERLQRAVRNAEIERDVLLEHTGRAILIPLLSRRDE